MANITKILILTTLEHWAGYAQVFGGLTADEQSSFLQEQGYASMRDLLAHVAAWWEEARAIIEDTLRQRERPARHYDFPAFNAAAISRFKGTPEEAFFEWYEAERRRLVALVSALTDDQVQMPRVRSWLDAVIVEHFKEHGVEAPRFLIVDTLQREWGNYTDRFKALPAEEQKAFLERQGFERFRDLLAHVVAWWEHGIHLIEEPGAAEQVETDKDVDAFNAVAVQRLGALDEDEVLRKYHETRLTLANLIDMLPEGALTRPAIRAWVRADVIEHYFEHAI